MKPFDELTDQELAALTDEQFDRYCERAIAEAGIPFLPTLPPRPTNANKPEPDLTVHRVGGFDFTNREDAEKVASLVSTFDRWHSKYERVGTDYHTVHTPDFEPVTIETVRVATKQGMQHYQASKALDAKRREEYIELEGEFTRINERRMKVIAELQQVVDAAKRRISKVDCYREYHRTYLDLAGGNQAIAARFFERAYPDAREILPEVFEFVTPPSPAPASTARTYEAEEV